WITARAGGQRRLGYCGGGTSEPSVAPLASPLMATSITPSLRVPFQSPVNSEGAASSSTLPSPDALISRCPARPLAAEASSAIDQRAAIACTQRAWRQLWSHEGTSPSKVAIVSHDATLASAPCTEGAPGTRVCAGFNIAAPE